MDGGMILTQMTRIPLLQLRQILVKPSIRENISSDSPSFKHPDYLALAARHHVATVFTDSDEHPSFADLTGDFVYARLMRCEAERPTGYAPEALDAWAARAADWARGRSPADLPHVAPPPASGPPREVFVFFINGAKERAPAAAQALITRLAR